MERRAEPLVVPPIESVIDHHRFWHSPRVVAKISGQILLFAPHDIAKHFVRPIHLPRDRLRVRIDQQFRAVEAQAALRIVRPGNAVTVELARPHIGQKHVPHLVGMLRHRDANIFLRRVELIEEAEVDRVRHLGKEREIHSVAEPRRSERIGITQPNFYRRHK